MTLVAFGGWIGTDDAQQVEHILRAWNQPGELRAKVRLSGQQFTLDTDEMSLYVHDDTGPEGPYYLVSGEAKMDLEKVGSDLFRLITLCKRQQVEAKFEYVELDEEGNEVGQELHID